MERVPRQVTSIPVSITDAELAGIDMEIGAGEYGSLVPGDTIEVHYMHSTAQVVTGPSLGACLSESIANPQLRVETQVFVLVYDETALDFVELTEFAEARDFTRPSISRQTRERRYSMRARRLARVTTGRARHCK